MKTIDKNKKKEAANQYLISNFLEECTMRQYIIDSFETGFELCQKEYEEKLRWIPVEEKLPEMLPANILLRSPILVKYKNGNMEVRDLVFPNGVSQWRYIDIK